MNSRSLHGDAVMLPEPRSFWNPMSLKPAVYTRNFRRERSAKNTAIRVRIVDTSRIWYRE